MDDKAGTDWEIVERDYRAGVKSVRQIAAEQGVSHTAIQKRARRDGWVRDLSARVRAAAEAKLARQVAIDPVATSVAKTTEMAIVEANATLQADIVRAHRADIQRARTLAARLLGDLESAAGNREMLETIIAAAFDKDASKADEKRQAAMMRAIGLGEHVGALESLSRTLKTLVGLEREAFGIDAASRPDDESWDVRMRRLFYGDTP